MTKVHSPDAEGGGYTQQDDENENVACDFVTVATFGVTGGRLVVRRQTGVGLPLIVRSAGYAPAAV